MKFIYCSVCEDIVALHVVTRECACGESSGRYLDDETNHVEVKGKCYVLGIDNKTLRHATALVSTGEADGGLIALFLLSPKSKTVKKIG